MPQQPPVRAKTTLLATVKKLDPTTLSKKDRKKAAKIQFILENPLFKADPEAALIAATKIVLAGKKGKSIELDPENPLHNAFLKLEVNVNLTLKAYSNLLDPTILVLPNSGGDYTAFALIKNGKESYGLAGLSDAPTLKGKITAFPALQHQQSIRLT